MDKPSAGDSIGFAISRTGDVLFRPFQFARWMVLAWPAALASLGEGGGGTFNVVRFGANPDLFRWARDHLPVVIGVSIALAVALTAAYLVCRWVASRGTFVAFDNVVSGEAEVKAPWARHAALGRSLFRFRLVWDLAVFNVFLLIVVAAGLIAWPDIRDGLVSGEYRFGGSSAAALVTAGLLLPAAYAAWVAGAFVLFSLAVPAMFLRGLPAWAAVKTVWRECVRPHPGPCALALLVQFGTGLLMASWATIGVLALTLFTCFVGFVFLLLPVVGTYLVSAVALPPLVFMRAYQLHFLSQFGPAYAVPWRGAKPRGGFPVILADPPAAAGV